MSEKFEGARRTGGSCVGVILAEETLFRGPERENFARLSLCLMFKDFSQSMRALQWMSHVTLQRSINHMMDKEYWIWGRYEESFFVINRTWGEKGRSTGPIFSHVRVVLWREIEHPNKSREIRGEFEGSGVKLSGIIGAKGTETLLLWGTLSE
ncbi:hypothetical protein C1645_743559 [Glomus cerebriforme]|uniref:Uncharacterized protein n=1 Tax=Glomus cerebriforme TaxID=658196 RepID=A0A397SCZ8_9GLOM|nr:hypothetical protein C1645_743559 [Glomus cerebriforme]